jgi:hypothetical protein
MPDPTLNRAAAGLLCCALFCPGSLAPAGTALDCLPPLPPAPVNDGGTRVAYAAEIREEYVAYFDEAQTYLHCLESARAEVTAEVKRAIADYQALGPVPDD